MTRPCGCDRDPITFGHDHPEQHVPFITAVIWRIIPASQP